MSYTKGPWKIGEEIKPMYAWKGQIIGKHPDGGGDFILASCNQNYPEMAIENARLIASAPDMLEALKILDNRGGLGLDVHEWIQGIIAKAEGKQ